MKFSERFGGSILQYDEINSDDVSGIEVSKLSPSLWYFIRDNFKAGVTTRFDVRGSGPAKHEVAMVMRAMF